MTSQAGDSPPARLRHDVSAAERDAIEAVTGVLSTTALRAIRDGRGREFQRLEFLGDSILDVLVTGHVLVSPHCPACDTSSGDIGRLVTDDSMAELANAAGVGTWLEWQASDERHADMVEACVAAAWLAGGWPRACAVVAAVFHDLSPLEDVMVGTTTFVMTDSKAARRTGAAFLELAAARLAFTSHPRADESQLSDMRASSHRADRVAQFARRTNLVPSAGDAAQVSDRVESEIARQLSVGGGDAALELADRVLNW